MKVSDILRVKGNVLYTVGPDEPLAHALEALADRGVILGHADGNRLPQAAVVTAQHQQLLAFGAQLQIALQTGLGQLRQLLVPQGTGAPVHVGKIDAEVMPGERPLVSRRQTSLIQLQALGAAHQGQQQVFAVVAQTGFKVTLQAHLKQPKAGLGQHQANHQHHADQAQAQAALDRPHAAPPNR